MPQAVIDKVNALATDQPSLITFTDKQGNEIGEDDDVITPPHQPDYKIPGVVEDIAKITGVDTEEAMDGNPSQHQMADLGNEPGHNKPPLIEGGTDFDPTINDSPTDETTGPQFKTDPPFN
jgi:hypothetical protein